MIPGSELSIPSADTRSALAGGGGGIGKVNGPVERSGTVVDANRGAVPDACEGTNSRSCHVEAAAISCASMACVGRIYRTNRRIAPLPEPGGLRENGAVSELLARFAGGVGAQIDTSQKANYFGNDIWATKTLHISLPDEFGLALSNER